VEMVDGGWWMVVASLCYVGGNLEEPSRWAKLFMAVSQLVPGLCAHCTGVQQAWSWSCSIYVVGGYGGTFPRLAWRDELAGGEQGRVPVSAPIGGAAAALDPAGQR